MTEKVEENEGNNTPTIAEMILLNKNEPIILPQKFMDALRHGGKKYRIIIFSSKEKFLRIYFTNSDVIVKIKLIIDREKSSRNYAQQMFSIYNSSGLQPIYSKHVHQKDIVIHEDYMHSPEHETVDIKKIKSKLRVIPELISISIDVIPISNFNDWQVLN